MRPIPKRKLPNGWFDGTTFFVCKCGLTVLRPGGYGHSREVVAATHSLKPKEERSIRPSFAEQGEYAGVFLERLHHCPIKKKGGWFAVFGKNDNSERELIGTFPSEVAADQYITMYSWASAKAPTPRRRTDFEIVELPRDERFVRDESGRFVHRNIFGDPD